MSFSSFIFLLALCAIFPISMMLTLSYHSEVFDILVKLENYIFIAMAFAFIGGILQNLKITIIRIRLGFSEFLEDVTFRQLRGDIKTISEVCQKSIMTSDISSAKAILTEDFYENFHTHISNKLYSIDQINAVNALNIYFLGLRKNKTTGYRECLVKIKFDYNIDHFAAYNKKTQLEKMIILGVEFDLIKDILSPKRMLSKKIVFIKQQGVLKIADIR